MVYADKKVLSFVLNLMPGQTLPIHQHEQSTLVCLVLAGSAVLKINQETQKITTGSVGIAMGEDDFSIPEVSEDLSLFVTISPKPANEAYAKEV
ncbi:MAG: cupin domain-containing protein [Firmicutes bacterium]|nr:cupin domain-containing protein [Bacillota bacterium]